MKYLESSLALRIMDILGLFSKDMPNTINDNFKLKKHDMWAVKVPIDGESDINILYSESGDKKYMITGSDKSKLWFCIIVGDAQETNPELNRIFISQFLKEDFSVREADTIEIANVFASFECLRHFFKGWYKFEPKENEISIMKKFISSIAEEDLEE